MSPALALVADIGGTHARFALADTVGRAPLHLDSVRNLAVADHASLVDAARHYLRLMDPLPRAPGQAVFGVAGRVEGDLARITNHPWVISRPEIAAALGLPPARVGLVNDFTAQAMATTLLEAGDLAAIGDVPLQAAAPARVDRTCAVIGPGTGLGVSALLLREGRVIPLETEGGHVSFAATTEQEAAVWAVLAARYGRVSNERLLSGNGLSNLHHALRVLAGDAEPAPLRPAEVTEGARQGDATCVRAVELFCEVFGAIAGDLVLTLGAWDGVFLAGGLVPKLIAELQGPAFRRRFEDKGRFAASLARVPVMAVLHPQPGLLGAAAIAGLAPHD
jgi:glucokinase